MTYEEAKMQIQAIPEKIWDQLSEPDREAMEMAFSALQAQEAKTQLSAEGTTSDLISRQDAIEVIEEMQMPIMRSMFSEEQFVFKGMSEALSAIKDLPSAHSEIEERKEEFAQNVPIEDLISRKAAINALGERPMVWTDDDQYALGERNQYDMNRLAIETLPSAQPEPCEDAVSRDSVKFLLCKETCHPGAFCPDGFCREICEKVDALPSATPKQRMGEWIPVSEKLPEKYGNYLISIHGEDEPDIGTISPNDKRGWSLCDAKGFHWASDKKLIVTAWMPLPEPYRAERRTDGVDN